MEDILKTIVTLDFELRIKKSEIVNQAEISLIDLKNNKSESQLLPIDNHLYCEKVCGCVDFLKDKLMKK